VNVLVVAAHPDDEVLGCGATIAHHAETGDAVEILILGTGALSRDGAGPGETERLAGQAAEAARILGARRARVLDLPDNRFDGVDLLEIVRRVEVEIQGLRPEIVYTHHAGDLNVDHRRTFQAVLTACRPQASGGVRKILSFEVPSSTEWQSPTSGHGFRPNVFVDVGRTLARKEAALAAYVDEVRPFPHPRSPEAVRALGIWRGASAGFPAAEAFELVRELL